MQHEQLSRRIIGAAMTVLNDLRPGLDERLYESALVVELTALGLTADQQRVYPVHYRGVLIGKLIPDLIVNEHILVDTKVVTAFNSSHVAQMLGYLAISGLEVALLLNFKTATLTWKRVIRTAQIHGGHPRHEI